MTSATVSPLDTLQAQTRFLQTSPRRPGADRSPVLSVLSETEQRLVCAHNDLADALADVLVRHAGVSLEFVRLERRHFAFFRYSADRFASVPYLHDDAARWARTPFPVTDAANNNFAPRAAQLEVLLSQFSINPDTISDILSMGKWGDEATRRGPAMEATWFLHMSAALRLSWDRFLVGGCSPETAWTMLRLQVPTETTRLLRFDGTDCLAVHLGSLSD